MSNRSTFMTEMEAKRIYSGRMKKLAWRIQFISLAVLLLSAYIANNSSHIYIGLVGLVIASAGLITGYIIQSRFSMD